MDRFLKPGFQAKPREGPPVTPRAKGRPKTKALEGALELGEKRVRLCASKKNVLNEQMVLELLRRVELLETVQSEAAAPDEKVQKALSLQEQAEVENRRLR